MSTPKTREEWRKAIDALPNTPEYTPAIFLAHGQPMLAWPDDTPEPRGPMASLFRAAGPQGKLHQFLEDLGPALLQKYKPKGIVVFSAHWETGKERRVTDYGDENPLLMDYYGFDPALYKLKYKSRGDSAITERVLTVLKDTGLPARATPATEARGRDGRGFMGPGLDHGVFVPFKVMFGEEMPNDVPVVQVSIHSSMDPSDEWAIGKAVTGLRKEGYLVIAGGLIVHTFQDFSAFDEAVAKPIYHEFQAAIAAAVLKQDPKERRQALEDLTEHRGFRAAHPREDHFVPLYIAAGAGEEGESRVLADIYGQATYVFGL